MKKYRMLKNGERIKYGDEYHTFGWIKVEKDGWAKPNNYDKEWMPPYRRPITRKGKK
jgi:hypothetical protein